MSDAERGGDFSTKDTGMCSHGNFPVSCELCKNEGEGGASSFFDTARGDYLVSDPETGEEIDKSGEKIKKIIETIPGLSQGLDSLASAELDDTSLAVAVKMLNDQFGVQGEVGGMYKQVTFDLPGEKQLRIKVWEQEDDALTFATV